MRGSTEDFVEIRQEDGPAVRADAAPDDPERPSPKPASAPEREAADDEERGVLLALAGG